VQAQLKYMDKGPHHPYTLTFLTVWLVPNYTAWWQTHMCEQLAQCCYPAVYKLRDKLATSQSLVQHATVRLLSHTPQQSQHPQL